MPRIYTNFRSIYVKIMWLYVIFIAYKNFYARPNIFTYTYCLKIVDVYKYQWHYWTCKAVVLRNLGMGSFFILYFFTKGSQLLPSTILLSANK